MTDFYVQGFRVTRSDGEIWDLVTAPVGKRRGQFLFVALSARGLVALTLPPDVVLAWQMAGGATLPGPVGVAEAQSRTL